MPKKQKKLDRRTKAAREAKKAKLLAPGIYSAKIKSARIRKDGKLDLTFEDAIVIDNLSKVSATLRRKAMRKYAPPSVKNAYSKVLV